MIRLFTAIELPDAIRQRVASLGAGVPGAKWTKLENLHLTLRFIGNVDGRLYGDIVDVLGHISVPRFDLQLQGLGQFGERKRVDMLWVGVKPNETLNRLQAKIEQAMQRLDLEPERRKFHPHVTIARLKGAPESRLAEFLAVQGGFFCEPFPVQEFVLLSSYLSHNGSIYQREATYPLKDNG